MRGQGRKGKGGGKWDNITLDNAEALIEVGLVEEGSELLTHIVEAFKIPSDQRTLEGITKGIKGLLSELAHKPAQLDTATKEGEVTQHAERQPTRWAEMVDSDFDTDKEQELRTTRYDEIGIWFSK